MYKSTMTQVGININANNGPTALTAARYQALFDGIIAGVFGPNDRHLQNQYLRYGIVTCDLPICYFYGRYRSLCEMMDRMPGTDPVPTEADRVNAIFNAQPDEHRDNFLRDHPSPHDVTHEELLSFFERLAPAFAAAPPLPAPTAPQPPRSDAPTANTDMPRCPLHPNGRHDFADCRLNPYSANYDDESVRQARAKRARISGPCPARSDSTSQNRGKNGTGNGTNSNAHTNTTDDTHAHLHTEDQDAHTYVDPHKADIWYQRTGYDPRDYPKGHFRNFDGYR
jgi:hypothetical protein